MLFITAILVAFAATNTFAQTKTPSAVEASFKRSFAEAENPSWTVVSPLFRADFTLNNESLTAFFDADGELVASSRSLKVNQLPIALQFALQKHVGNYTVSSLFEVDRKDGVVYYARVADQRSERLLRSTSYGEWVTN